MTFNWKDFRQSAIGSFIAIIVFFAIRGDNPFFFDPIRGLFITIILMFIYYNGFKMMDKKRHFMTNMVISFGICAVIAQTFGLITTEEILSFKVFGSLVIVGFWIAFPAGLLYDRYNILNPMKRKYIRGN